MNAYCFGARSIGVTEGALNLDNRTVEAIIAHELGQTFLSVLYDTHPSLALADGTARVQETSGKIYYINEEGKRITKDYQDGSLTFEMQGLYCRVQEEDGTWEIINRDDKVIFSGAEMIGDLPNVTCLGSAIVDGKAVLFELLPFEQNEEEIRIIANYESFVRISCVYNGQFAFVWTEDNLMGVVDYDGNVIVTPEYQKIEYAYRGGDYTMDELVFIAHGNNGIIQVINARNQEKIIES